MEEKDNKLANVQHTQIVEHEDNELRILRDELRDTKAREVNVVAKYRRSMDFVHRHANRYNGEWSAAMGCARYALRY